MALKTNMDMQDLISRSNLADSSEIGALETINEDEEMGRKQDLHNSESKVLGESWLMFVLGYEILHPGRTLKFPGLLRGYF